MNITFKQIDIESFRSIDKAKVILENQGTVIVKGINEYEDKATSNGSGKSSIFEAIIFALFEETSSGEKDVANRIIGNGYRVTLQFAIDNNIYTIVRSCENKKTSVILYKNDIDISARNKTDTNKLIIDILGISKNIFLDSIFLSQNANTNLASLSPTARKERLEVLTNTDSSIAAFKEKLKQKQSEYDSLCVESQLNINKLTGNIDTLKSQIDTFNIKIAEIDKQIEARNQLGNIEDIEIEITNNNNQITQMNENILNLNQNITNLDNTINTKEDDILKIKNEGQANIDNKSELETNINNLRDSYNEIDRQIIDCNSNIQYCENNKKRLLNEIEEIKNSDKCPTCGRKYEDTNEDHIKEIIDQKSHSIDIEDNMIKDIEVNKVNLEKQLSEVEMQGKELKEQLAELQKQIDEHNTLIDNKQLEIKELNNQKTSIHNEIQNIQFKINNTHTEISKLQEKKQQILEFKVGDKSEYEEMVNKLNEDVNNINKTIQEETEKYNTNNNYVGAIKHSIQLVTKEFRTYLLQNSLKYLNKLLEEYSHKLFSNDYDIIQIKEDDAKLDIVLGNAPYESLSGGEKTRVNIAILLAQKSLANIIGNTSCNMIILDEILGYCDSKAEENVVNLITQELESLESIYMISHKEIPIGYDSELIVVKDRQGLSKIKVH